MAVCIVLLLSGCVISPRRPDPGAGSGGGTPTPTPTPTPVPTPTPTPAPTGKLYVSNDTANAILRFDNAFTANGAASPAAPVTGASTKLNSPQYVFLDAATDQLYVANSGTSSILVFSNASTMSGNVAPSREITAVKLGGPSDVALDKTRDLLYVVDGADILSFANATTANGLLTPTQDLALTFAPQAIFVDAANNRMYVADPAGNQIVVFDAVSTLNGGVVASRTISGAGTQLAAPSGVLVDSGGRLVVTNSGTTATITIYSNAATANGNLAPVAVISGASTTLSGPNQIVADAAPSGGELYVADPTAGSVDIFANLAAANGNIAPTRRLTGTGVTQGSAAPTARGVALDITR